MFVCFTKRTSIVQESWRIAVMSFCHVQTTRVLVIHRLSSWSGWKDGYTLVPSIWSLSLDATFCILPKRQIHWSFCWTFCAFQGLQPHGTITRKDRVNKCATDSSHWNLLDGLQVDSHDQRIFLYHQASYHTSCGCYDTLSRHCLLGNHNELFLYQAKILKFRQIPCRRILFLGVTINKVSPTKAASPIRYDMHAGVWPGVAKTLHWMFLPRVHCMPSEISLSNCSPVGFSSSRVRLYFLPKTCCTWVTSLPIQNSGFEGSSAFKYWAADKWSWIKEKNQRWAF